MGIKSIGRFLVVVLLSLFLVVFLYVRADGYERLTVGLRWQMSGGPEKQEALATEKLSGPVSKLWVFFQKKGSHLYPAVSIGGKIVSVSVPVEQMNFLELVATLKGYEESMTKRSLLFSRNRPVGSRSTNAKNVYHLLILQNFVTTKDLPSSLKDVKPPLWPLKKALWRTHRLAMNYAVQTDAKTKELESLFQVKASYKTPRLILVAEEWLDVPEKAKTPKRRRGGGLFGGALEEVSKEIAGEKEEAKSKMIPVYSIDVLLDEISAEGKYPNGFQAARSIWNDITEGEVIYQATKGTRRVITASVVFSQMEKNRATRNSKNRILKFDAQNSDNINQCNQLWPSAQREIKNFLKENPDWRIIIPQNPVVFYKNNRPIYAMYAWFQVNPKTGRMIGVLPSGIRGALSDEMAQVENGVDPF